MEAGGGPGRWFQTTVHDHVPSVFEPGFIAEIVHDCDFLHITLTFSSKLDGQGSSTVPTQAGLAH